MEVLQPLVDSTIPPAEEIERADIKTLIKLRFFAWKGKAGKNYTDAKAKVEQLMLLRAGDFTLDDLANLLSAYPHWYRYVGKKEDGRLTDTVIETYNRVLTRLVPFDHPERYRYVMEDYLNDDGWKQESLAWLFGNSHKTNHPHKIVVNLRRMVKSIGPDKFNSVVNHLIERRSPQAGLFVADKRLRADLRLRILQMDFVKPRHMVGNITFPSQAITMIHPQRLPARLREIAGQHGRQHFYDSKHKYKTNFSIDMPFAEIQKLMFTHTMADPESAAAILNDIKPLCHPSS